VDIGTGLAVIENSGLLSNNMVDLSSLAKELDQTHRTVQVFRTPTEMEVSVLNDTKHPTPDSKYWQAVKEQDAHYTNLVMLSFDHEEQKLELQKLERDLTEEEDDLEASLISVKISRLDFILGLQRREGYHRLREIRMWSAKKAKLAKQCKYSLTDVNEHQGEAMVLRFNKQVKIIEGMTTGAADRINQVSLAESARKYAEK